MRWMIYFLYKGLHIAEGEILPEEAQDRKLGRDGIWKTLRSGIALHHGQGR